MTPWPKRSRPRNKKKIVSTFKHSYKQKLKKCTILTLMSFENYSHTNPSVFVNCFSLCSGVAQHSTWKRPRSHLSTTTRTTSSRFLETPKIASNQALSFNLTLAVVFEQKMFQVGQARHSFSGPSCIIQRTKLMESINQKLQVVISKRTEIHRRGAFSCLSATAGRGGVVAKSAVFKAGWGSIL